MTGVQTCALPIYQVGKQGAAWDELIANSDRHYLNLIFDGKWWLFDHDKAIPTANQTAQLAAGNVKNEFPDFILKLNQLALQMLNRHPNSHAIDKQVKEFEKQKARLNALDHCVSSWTKDIQDTRLLGIFTDTAYLINLIASRLPALAMHIDNRIGIQSSGESYGLNSVKAFKTRPIDELCSYLLGTVSRNWGTRSGIGGH